MASSVTKFKVTYLNFIKCISVLEFDEIIMSFKHKTKCPGFDENSMVIQYLDDELGEFIDLDHISQLSGRRNNHLNIVCHQYVNHDEVSPVRSGDSDPDSLDLGIHRYVLLFESMSILRMKIVFSNLILKNYNTKRLISP